MKCNDCVPILSRWITDSEVDLCPKHAMVDELLELYKLCQVCLTYTDWLDAEQDIRGAVHALAKADPRERGE